MKRIVIAEDDPEVLMLLSSTLQSRGYVVAPAYDGSEAWRLIQQQIPDAAILDMNMPGLDGLEVCRRIRTNSRTRHVGVIFLTGFEDIARKTAAFKAGADDYIVKPFAPRELRLRLESVIARAEANHAGAPPVPPTPRPFAPAVTVSPEGRTTALFGIKGGVGTSAVAVNLAVALGLTSLGVAMIDLDLEHAIDNVLLDLPASRQGTIVDLSRGVNPDLEWEYLQSFLVAHPTGLKLLPGPPTALEAELVKGHHVKLYQSLLRANFDHVILDLHSSYREVNLDVIETCDRLLLVVTPDVPAIKVLRGVIEVLSKLRLTPGKVQLVLNQTSPIARLSVGDIRRASEVPVVGAIPYGGEEFINAYNLGQPIVQLRPQHAASLAFKRLATALTQPVSAQP